MHLENKITTGNIIQIVALFAVVVSAWNMVANEQKSQADRLVRVEARADDHGSRLRAVENAQAAQSSDLRNIQAGIVRIEAAVERLSQESH